MLVKGVGTSGSSIGHKKRRSNLMAHITRKWKQPSKWQKTKPVLSQAWRKNAPRGKSRQRQRQNRQYDYEPAISSRRAGRSADLVKIWLLLPLTLFFCICSYCSLLRRFCEGHWVWTTFPTWFFPRPTICAAQRQPSSKSISGFWRRRRTAVFLRGVAPAQQKCWQVQKNTSRGFRHGCSPPSVRHFPVARIPVFRPSHAPWFWVRVPIHSMTFDFWSFWGK